jgi:hypothetical protein
MHKLVCERACEIVAKLFVYGVSVFAYAARVAARFFGHGAAFAFRYAAVGEAE